MQTGTNESRKRRRARRRHRKRRKIRILITISIVFAFLAVAVVGFLFFTGNAYRDAEGFDEYSKTYIELLNENEAKGGTSVESAKKEQVVEYGTPLSTLAEYPTIADKRIEVRAHMAIDERIKQFKLKHEKAAERDQFVLFLRSRTYSSPKGALGFVLYENRQMEHRRNMVDTSSHVYTYNFSSDTGRPLSTYQIFRKEYRVFCSQYLRNYFEKNETGDLEKDRYKKTLEAVEKNLNRFVLEENGVRFYFEAGTVLKKERGSVSAEISYRALRGTIREQILIRYIDPDKPMVALTYDDGPYPKVSNRILDCLDRYNAVATFFELGKNVKAYPDVVKRKAALGMEIGSHSWSHPNLSKLSAKKVKSQMKRTERALKKACGQSPTVFRPPYGNSNKKVKKYANAPIVLWSVDTLDWKSRKSKSVVRVVKGVDDLDGRVILMHSLYGSTAKATEKLVPWLLDEGYQLVTVSELLEYRYNEIPEKGKLYGYGYFYPDKGKKDK